MTLQQLRYFVSACRHRNISHAAEEFSVSQPSVSLAIKNLENEFGVCLIRRCRTGFALTEAGEEFKGLAESLLKHADSVERAMYLRGENRHCLRLGVPPMVASILFPAVYSDFRTKHTDVEIFTQEMGRDHLLKALEDDFLDMAFLPHTESFPDTYISIPVMQFETVCCVSKGHYLAHKQTVSPADLANEPLVLFPEGFFQTERILEVFAKQDVRPQVVHTSPQLSTIEQFIAGSIAIGFLFRDVAEKNEDIIPIPFTPRLYTQISLVMCRDRYISDGMRCFMEYIQKEQNNV